MLIVNKCSFVFENRKDNKHKQHRNILKQKTIKAKKQEPTTQLDKQTLSQH